MKKLSHIFLGISFVSFIMLIGTRYILGGWQNFLVVPLASFLIFFICGLFLNRREYLSFFTLRTTREGFNTGTIIIFFVLFLGAVNYFGIQFDKSFDFTTGKIFTLSPQSAEAVKSLKQPAEIFVFHVGPVAEEGKRPYRDLLKLYAGESSNVSFKFLDAYNNPELAKKYIQKHDIQNRKIFAYIDYKDRVVSVDHPMSEEQFTQAFVKLTRTQSNQVYFTQGHKEWNLLAIEDDPFGLGLLRKTLEGYSFNISSLDLAVLPDVPEDASVVAIIGPKSHFAKNEIDALIRYAKRGGRFIIGLDPGVTQNLGPFLKKLSINFKNNYIHDPASALGQMTITAKQYSKTHPITKDFADRMTVLNLASEVTTVEGASLPAGESLVFSSSSSAALNELAEPSADVPRGSYSLGVSVTGIIEGAEKPFSAVMFGDSDLFRSELLYVFSNRDLIVNSMAYLTEQKDLISIKPKLPSETEVKVTRANNMIFVILVIFIPLILFTSAFVLWFRRRGGE